MATTARRRPTIASFDPGALKSANSPIERERAVHLALNCLYAIASTSRSRALQTKRVRWGASVRAIG